MGRKGRGAYSRCFGLRRREVRLLLWIGLCGLLLIVIKAVLPITPFFAHDKGLNLHIAAWGWEGDKLKTAPVVRKQAERTVSFAPATQPDGGSPAAPAAAPAAFPAAPPTAPVGYAPQVAPVYQQRQQYIQQQQPPPGWPYQPYAAYVQPPPPQHPYGPGPRQPPRSPPGWIPNPAPDAAAQYRQHPQWRQPTYTQPRQQQQAAEYPQR